MNKLKKLIMKIDKEIKLSEEACEKDDNFYYQGYIEALQKVRAEIICDFNLLPPHIQENPESPKQSSI